MNKRIQDVSFLLLVSTAVVLLDQWTKSIVRSELAYGQAWAPWDWLLPYMRIVHVQNTGVAFGMLQGLNDVFRILPLIVAGIIIYYYFKVPREDWLLRLAMALQLGGAIGNLLDRIYRGHVTDFVSLGRFPVFNVADASISIGVALLIISMWLNERSANSPGSVADLDKGESQVPEEIQGG